MGKKGFIVLGFRIESANRRMVCMRVMVEGRCSYRGLEPLIEQYKHPPQDLIRWYLVATRHCSAAGVHPTDNGRHCACGVVGTVHHRWFVLQ